MAIETVSASPNAITERLPLRLSWVLTGLAALTMGGSGAAKIAQAPAVVANFTEARLAGYLLPIGALELIVVVLLVIPRTSSLGILLTTGYLGGAVLTHLESGHPGQAIVPIVVGLLAWAGHYLRVPAMFSTLLTRPAQRRPG